jgi:hypothetical protein
MNSIGRADISFHAVRYHDDDGSGGPFDDEDGFEVVVKRR